SFSAQTAYSVRFLPYSLAAGDFNNDTQLDIVAANYGDDSISVLLGYDIGALENEISFAPADGSLLRGVVVSDVNNDILLDVIVANYGTNTIGAFLGHNNSTFENQLKFSMGFNAHPYTIAIGDFNTDGQADISVVDRGTKSIGLLLGNGNGMFRIQDSHGRNYEFPPLFIGAGDFDNDSRSDIVVAYDGTDNIDVLVAYESGSLTKHMIYSAGSSPQCVTVADLNKDTLLDIVVANVNGNNISVLLGYGNGSFGNQMTYSTGSYPQSVAVGDFNSDTQLDIVVANRGDNTISVLLGYGNGSFGSQMAYSTGSYPQSVAVGDFNSDTQLDIVVANR
ncbi:unnamed protein product, partial [Rotaria magnacalcarata]